MIRKLPAFVLMTVLTQVCFGQQPRMINLDQHQKMIQSKNEPIQVINFWATWCGPCVKELPLIEKLGQERKEVKITLVSMDIDLDPNPEKVYKFVARKNIQSRVVILRERDPNSWINKIDKNC